MECTQLHVTGTAHATYVELPNIPRVLPSHCRVFMSKSGTAISKAMKSQVPWTVEYAP